jgi:hypothetical protein
MRTTIPFYRRWRLPAVLAGVALSSLVGGASAATLCGQEVKLVAQAVKQAHCAVVLPVDFGGNGAAWRRSAIDASRSFQSSFSFTLSPTSVTPMADGVALVIQAQGHDVVGTGGGYLGIPAGSVAAAVQTFANNRVGLTLNGDPYGVTAFPADLGNAALVTGSLSLAYDATLHTLALSGVVTVDGQSYEVAETQSVDLKAVFGRRRVWIGLTGGTGGSTATQVVSDWRFSQ